MPNSRFLMVVLPGFFKETGYYYRVARELEALMNKGYSVDVMFITLSYPTQIKRNTLENLKRQMPAHNFFFFGLNALFRLCNYSFFHAQNISAAVVIILLKVLGLIPKKSYKVLDYHGCKEEVLDAKYGHLRFRINSWAEKKCIEIFDAIITVSREHINYLLKEHRKERIIEITKVLPNWPSTIFLEEIERLKRNSRQVIRKSLGWTDSEVVFIYVGNAQSWQGVDTIAAICASIQKNMAHSKFIFLTRDVDKIKQYLQEAAVTNFDIRTVENTEVPKYLMAADFAFMIRPKSIINRVACPTKAMEYIVAGLAMIISEGVGDISEWVSVTGNGIVFDGNVKVLCEELNRRIDKKCIQDTSFMGDIDPSAAFNPLFSLYEKGGLRQ
jgi:glycosyltransferase involved in cell wall biosynthesis